MSTDNSSDSWQRHYAAHGSTAGAVVFTIIGVVFFMMGSLFAVGGFMGWHAAGAPLFAGVGSLFAVLGLVLPCFAIYTYRHGKDLDIYCQPGGFTVQTKSRSAGVQEERYAWRDVIATEYTEQRYRSSNQHGRRTTGYFAVQTARGPAFTVTDSMGQFPDMINVFNQLTPQLPYVWSQQVGFNFSIGSIGHRLAYAQTPRNAGTSAEADVVDATTASSASLPAATPLIGRAPLMAEPTPLPTNETNIFGLLGLIISGLSLPMCGLIAPLGLLLSVIGLFRPKKGLAIAGAALGFVGTALLSLVGWGVIQGMILGGQLKEVIETEVAIEQATLKIIQHRTNEGSLPDNAAGQMLILGDRDAYGTGLRYKRLTDDEFEVRSAGPDHQFDTVDDLKKSGDGLPLKSPTIEGPVEVNPKPPEAGN